MPNGNYELSIYAPNYIKIDGIRVSVPSTNNDYKLDRYKGSITFSVPYIDMGAIIANNIVTFSIDTKGNNELTWKIDNDNRTWIKSIEPKEGKGDKNILLEIDRNRIKANRENNYATITVSSTMPGDVSNDRLLLTVTETGNGVNLSELTIQEEKVVIAPTSATIPCEILNSRIINDRYEVGIIYSSTNKYPDDKDGTREKATTIEGSSFVSELKLEPNTQYWAIAYAYNESKTPKYYWGNKVITFKTSTTLPAVKMLSVDTTATTATFYAEISNIGIPEYISRGFVYHTTQAPTTENAIEVLPIEKNEHNIFSGKATKIEFNKNYWVRSYANNNDTTIYSLPLSFKAKMTMPTFSTPIVTFKNINSGLATFKCTITNIGDPGYTSRGFVYGINRPTTKENAIGMISVEGSMTADEFEKQVTNIQEGKIYYVYAYAENENYTEYSNEYATLDFQAKAPTLTTPILKEKNMVSGTAIFESTITLGDLSCVERGFVCGVNRNPRIENNQNIKILSGSGGGIYSGSFINIPEGRYFVCAYAKTSNGKFYYSSSDAELNLMKIDPKVSTSKVTDFGYDYAVLNGYMLNTGDPIYDACGFIYSTNSNLPLSQWVELSVTRNKIVGTYSYKLESLTHGTAYYVRTFVKVGEVYFYGDEILFETQAYYKKVPNTNIIMQMYDISTGSNWEEARQLCEASNAGEYNSGWRLPTIGELSAIYSMYSANILKGNFCTDLTDCKYWSSTFMDMVGGDKNYQTYIFSLGMSFWDATYVSNHVRCVRTLP